MVLIKRFKWNEMFSGQRFVPLERFMWNEMVFALWFVLCERISGKNPFTRGVWFRLNVLDGTKWA